MAALRATITRLRTRRGQTIEDEDRLRYLAVRELVGNKKEAARKAIVEPRRNAEEEEARRP